MFWMYFDLNVFLLLSYPVLYIYIYMYKHSNYIVWWRYCSRGSGADVKKQRMAPPCGWLTHAISLTVKMRRSRNILTGTVRMRTKGKASDAWVDITAQRTAKHTTWMHVNRCMRSVRTWTKNRVHLCDARQQWSETEKKKFQNV